MNDAVSRKAILEWAKNRKKALRADLNYAKKEDTGWAEFLQHQVKMHSEFIEHVESLPSILSPAAETADGWKVCPACGEDYRAGEDVLVSAAEGRYREFINRLDAFVDFSQPLDNGDWGIEDASGINGLFQEIQDEFEREALSPSSEQPGPSKSTMGLMTKEDDGE